MSHFIQFAIATFVSVGTLLGSERPNFLFITSEDNSAHWLGCYGNSQARTPQLDALAAEAVVFEHAYSNAPVCAVARATILMGIHAPAMGVQHMRSRHAIPAAWRPGVESLRKSGYYTTNNSKTDYNIRGEDRMHWHDSSPHAHYRNRQDGAPFYAVFNLMHSHESSLFDDKPANPRRLSPRDVELPPYLPDLPEIRNDIARYHDRIEDMDAAVGKLLEELEREGLAESTIVVYLSDHGGALPRGKRYLMETGVKVPLMIRIPEKFRHLSPFAPGTRVEEPVSFVDLAPTFLSLSGIEPLDCMQGRPFLGHHRRVPAEDDMVFLYADRFDELYGMCRGITDGRWKYIRNFNPHLPNAPLSFYPFRQPGWRAIRQAFIDGKLDAAHRALWEAPSAVEQLYDLKADPWEIENLATDDDHTDRLASMRARLQSLMANHRDTGVIPEPMFSDFSRDSTIADSIRADPLGHFDLIHLMFAASSGEKNQLPRLLQAAESGDIPTRYWATIGLRVLADENTTATLKQLAQDPHPTIRALAAESLFLLGHSDAADIILNDAIHTKMDEPQFLYQLNTLRRLDLLDDLPAGFQGHGEYSKRLIERMRNAID